MLAALGGLALCLAGCNGCVSPPPLELPLPQDLNAGYYQSTKGLHINLYVDGSGSIEHFIHLPGKAPQSKSQDTPTGDPSRTNYLGTLLGNIQGAMRTEKAWVGVPMQFWRFGGDCPVHMPDDGLANMQHHPEIAFPEKTTKIDVVYKDDPTKACSHPGKPAADTQSSSDVHPELKIMITDLYVSSHQQADLGRIIALKYFGDSPEKAKASPGNAVSVLAIRNPFFGRAEDFPGDEVSKPLATSMPIYVILSGPSKDVQYATQLLIDKEQLIDAFKDGNAKLMYFSTAPTISANQKPSQVEGSHRRKFNEYQPNYHGSAISLFTLSSGRLQLHWPEPLDDNWAAPPGTVWQKEWSISPSKPEYIVQTSVTNFGSKKKAQSFTDAGVVSAASPCSTSGPICIAIDRGGLRTGTTYLFRFDLQRLGSDNFRDRADAMKEWSIEWDAARRISSDPSGKFPSLWTSSDKRVKDPNPGLTPGLAEFLTDLQGVTYANNSPHPTDSRFIYLQAN